MSEAICLDHEIIGNILDKLENRADVIKCAALNHRWRALALEEKRWERYCSVDFGIDDLQGSYISNYYCNRTGPKSIHAFCLLTYFLKRAAEHTITASHMLSKVHKALAYSFLFLLSILAID
jgi:hypothetical protein